MAKMCSSNNQINDDLNLISHFARFKKLFDDEKQQNAVLQKEIQIMNQYKEFYEENMQQMQQQVMQQQIIIEKQAQNLSLIKSMREKCKDMEKAICELNKMLEDKENSHALMIIQSKNELQKVTDSYECQVKQMQESTEFNNKRILAQFNSEIDEYKKTIAELSNELTAVKLQKQNDVQKLHNLYDSRVQEFQKELNECKKAAQREFNDFRQQLFEYESKLQKSNARILELEEALSQSKLQLQAASLSTSNNEEVVERNKVSTTMAPIKQKPKVSKAKDDHNMFRSIIKANETSVQSKSNSLNNQLCDILRTMKSNPPKTLAQPKRRKMNPINSIYLEFMQNED